MLNRVAFTMYPVTDMAAARDFYEGHLALTTSAGATSPWVEYACPAAAVS
jgi:catechol 2,3-dioxygenase-like lactoylglutathione lyase family enzyme